MTTTKCGTYAGFSAHKRAEEEICELCREYKRESRRKSERKARVENPEMVRARKLRYAEKYPDKIKEQGRRYREKNRDAIREKKRKYKYPEARRESNKRYNERKKRNKSKYTQLQVIALYGTNCHLCNDPIDFFAPVMGKEGWEKGLHIDHVIPVSQNGADSIENVRPAHAICNLKKGGN